MFGKQNMEVLNQGMKTHSNKIAAFIGLILIFIGGLGLLKFAFYGSIFLLVLGVILFGIEYVRKARRGDEIVSESFIKTVFSDFRLIFLLIVILFTLLVLFLLLLKAGGFIRTILSLASHIPGIGADSLLRSFLILVFGLILLFFGPGFWQRIMGILLLIAGITIGDLVSGTSTSIVVLLDSFGSAEPNYLLFFIALFTGLLMLFKLKGVLPKFLGILLPLFTFPPVSGTIARGLNTTVTILLGEPSIFGISPLTIVLGILSLLSGFYIFEKISKDPMGVYSAGVKATGVLLASLLIIFSFSGLGSIFLGFLSDTIFRPIMQFFLSFVDFAPDIGSLFGSGFYFVVGVILLFSESRLKGFAQKGRDLAVGAVKSKFFDNKEKRAAKYQKAFEYYKAMSANSNAPPEMRKEAYKKAEEIAAQAMNEGIQLNF